MASTESKAISSFSGYNLCILLIFLLLIEAYAHVYHLVLVMKHYPCNQTDYAKLGHIL